MFAIHRTTAAVICAHFNGFKPLECLAAHRCGQSCFSTIQGLAVERGVVHDIVK